MAFTLIIVNYELQIDREKSQTGENSVKWNGMKNTKIYSLVQVYCMGYGVGFDMSECFTIKSRNAISTSNAPSVAIPFSSAMFYFRLNMAFTLKILE